MRYELTDHEWIAIKPILPNKPRGVPRVMTVVSSTAFSEFCGCGFALRCRQLQFGYPRGRLSAGRAPTVPA
jgi:transposase